MNVSLYQAAAAMNVHVRWQELIAQNLASTAVPGFKRQELALTAVPEGPQGDQKSSQSEFASLLTPTAKTFTNFEKGETKHTGSLTDVAIDGPGFFSVQLPNGTTAYTRDGEFHFDKDGMLVTKQGYPVLSDGGPIQKDINNLATVSISPSGEVSQGSDVKGIVKLVDFERPEKLVAISDGLFAAPDPAAGLTTPVGSTLRQYFLEGSNVSASAEMARLIVAMRMFEANQRIMQQEDNRMDRTIRDLTGPN